MSFHLVPIEACYCCFVCWRIILNQFSIRFPSSPTSHQPKSATRSDEKEACERKIKIDSLFLIDLCSQRRILLQQLLFLFLCRPLFLEQRLQDLVVSFLSEEMKIDDCAQNLSEPCRIRCGQVFDREIVDATCVEELRATDYKAVSERAEGNRRDSEFETNKAIRNTPIYIASR